MNINPMETAAVYSESKIRTYGFLLQEGMNLIAMDPANDALLGLKAALTSELKGTCRFEWICAQLGSNGASGRFWLLCNDDNARIITAYLGRCPDPPLSPLSPMSITPSLRVDAIHFQGPHFGDRYGIANYTLTALDSHGISLVGMTCAVSGICLVVAYGLGHQAKKTLEAVFEIPQKVRSQKRSTPRDSG